MCTRRGRTIQEFFLFALENYQNEASTPQTNEIRAISLTVTGFKATAEFPVVLGYCDKPEQRKISFYRKNSKL